MNAPRMFQTAVFLTLGCLLVASSAQAANKKHHITLALGYERLLSSDLKDDASGVDFRNAGYGATAYRFSVKPNLDLTLDARATESKDTSGGLDLKLTNTYFGPGIRVVSPKEGTRPYVQANFFLVREEVEVSSGGVTITGHDNGAGFGLSAGIDIRAGNLLSVPVEANYMYGKPGDNISGVGINAGLTFNFGELK